MGTVRMKSVELTGIRHGVIQSAVQTVFATVQKMEDRREVLNAVFGIELESEQSDTWVGVPHCTDDVLNQLDARAETLNECFALIEKNALQIEKMRRALVATVPVLEMVIEIEKVMKK